MVFLIVFAVVARLGAGGNQNLATIDWRHNDGFTARIASPEMFSGSNIGLKHDIYSFGTHYHMDLQYIDMNMYIMNGMMS